LLAFDLTDAGTSMPGSALLLISPVAFVAGSVDRERARHFDPVASALKNQAIADKPYLRILPAQGQGRNVTGKDKPPILLRIKGM
jgi:hypothetical protein